ncbi:Diphthamide biosynthesis protein 3 [Saitozyma podzolica]|uniref:Diphthamide biosynthesis protein 3 n=1 Tax=Saitozyma podzolica TaxID=1890683 RepID=A0A427Y801_9TREE|nr:Diphthamide biosynthesis protein 3 [Saitozyma podzolica]
MINYYDELEIEDFSWDPVAKVFHYPCPCGDRFEISKGQLRNGEEVATCPSCSLIVRVVYDYLDWEDYATTDDEDGDGESDAGSFTSAATSPGEAKPSRDEAEADGRSAEGEERRNGLRGGAVMDDGRAADALAVAVETLSMDTGHDR